MPSRESLIASLMQTLPESLTLSDLSALYPLAERLQTKRDLEKSLLAFTKYFFKAWKGEEFIENWHHVKICEALEAVERGEIKNLLINLPPRYSKTEIAVKNWIARCMGKNPRAKFIHLSYSDDLALDNSSEIKDLIRSDEFQQLWPLRLKDDSQSKKKWYTQQGGGVYAAAAGGAITGFGAGSTVYNPDIFGGAIVIDDPLKADHAFSETEREKVNRRLVNTIQSRRNDPHHTPIVIIMQRLHEDDMSGFVLAGGMGEEFHHLKIPAISDGVALWPAKHTLDMLLALKAADSFTFSGQYMQEPSPEEGSFFLREHLRYYDTAPQHMRTYISSDYAVTEGGGDWTVHLVVGVDPRDDIYLLDMWRDRTDSLTWVEALLDMAARYKPLELIGEKGQIDRSVKPLLRKRMQERKQYYYERTYNMPKGGSDRSAKEISAQAIRGRFAQGKVYLPRHAPWVADLIHEMMMFPAGKHDDQIDCLALIGRRLAELVAAVVPKVPADPIQEMLKPKTFNDLLAESRRMRKARESY